MNIKSPHFWVAVVGILHLAIMAGEMFPWINPFAMNSVVSKWPGDICLSPDEEELVSMVVHNAAVYNGIVGFALIAAARLGNAALSVEVTLLAGIVVAGVFGAVTLRSPIVLLQAASGAIPLVWLVMTTRSSPPEQENNSAATSL